MISKLSVTEIILMVILPVVTVLGMHWMIDNQEISAEEYAQITSMLENTNSSTKESMQDSLNEMLGQDEVVTKKELEQFKTTFNRALLADAAKE